ncbi:contact-dependent growth inhibition system immunity protein [Streptomyces virginiae]|uniref:contact-dependent growth inhibition system immunity protein n=1 Tax=Streptomyces virginiae TaxID=1961 RepID=UPI00364F7775
MTRPCCSTEREAGSRTVGTIPGPAPEPADLRTLITQYVGLPYVLPLAVRLLLEEPMLDSYFYAGDLLLAVLGRPESVWVLLPGLREGLMAVVAGLSEEELAELRTYEPAVRWG